VIQVEFVVPPEVDVLLPPTVWLAVKPSRATVGVLGGSPALLGFSSDIVDFPGTACNADAGGFPGTVESSKPHASFNAEIFVRDDCPSTFPAYRVSSPGRNGFSEGPRWCMAEDIELSVDECDMVAYELGVRLNNFTSVSSFRTRLFDDDVGLPGAEVPGTSKSVSISSGPGAYVLRYTFDPPIRLPSRKLWISFEAGATGAGWILAQKAPDIGTGDPRFVRSASGRRCSLMVTDPDWE